MGKTAFPAEKSIMIDTYKYSSFYNHVMDTPRIGVYVCHCGFNIAGVIDVKRVAEEASKLEGVVLSKDEKYLCSQQGQDLLKKDIHEHRLNRIVIAACSPKLHELTFRRALEDAKLNPYLLEMVNIREQGSWVHMHNPSEATLKAVDLTRMGVAKARLLKPGKKMKVPVRREALVIGGGVSGIQAALDLANNGFQVYLVEKEPSIGGHMAQLDKVFPTNDCSICVLAPKMADLVKHPKIKLLSYAEVKEVTGYVGNFKVKIFLKPRYVDSEKCNSCGVCEEVCPIKVPNEFDKGIKPRGAIYRPFPQSIPPIYTIDTENCIGCGLCVAVCEPDAIDFYQKPVEIELNVGTIIVATGCDIYDPSKTHDYGYGIYQNVITSIELERMLCSTSPTGGYVLRPSDKKPPKRVAFIQCVGSRSKKANEYCSVVCCAYAMKEAQCIKERHPETSIDIFYIDIRTPGELEEYFERTQAEYSVRFIRGKVAEVYEDPVTKNITLFVEDTVLGKMLELEYDLVVLSVGLTPQKDTEKIARILGLSRSWTGFLAPAHPKFKPVDTMVDGIFVCGAATGPKDISTSVIQASAAAARAAALMSAGEYEIEVLPSVIDLDKCKSCLLCSKVCPYSAITVENRKPQINPALCKACGICAAACPANAIEVPSFTSEQIMAQIREALKLSGTTHDLEPKIIAFCCNWCGYAGADNAGLTRSSYPANVRIIRLLCTGRIDTRFILEAFKEGADGVFIAACHPPDCHYVKGNKHCLNRYELIKNIADMLGIEPQRIRFEYISASEGPKFAKAITEFTEEIKKLGINPVKAMRLKSILVKAK